MTAGRTPAQLARARGMREQAVQLLEEYYGSRQSPGLLWDLLLLAELYERVPDEPEWRQLAVDTWARLGRSLRDVGEGLAATDRPSEAASALLATAAVVGASSEPRSEQYEASLRFPVFLPFPSPLQFEERAEGLEDEGLRGIAADCRARGLELLASLPLLAERESAERLAVDPAAARGSLRSLCERFAEEIAARKGAKTVDKTDLALDMLGQLIANRPPQDPSSSN